MSHSDTKDRFVKSHKYDHNLDKKKPGNELMSSFAHDVSFAEHMLLLLGLHNVLGVLVIIVTITITIITMCWA